LSKRYINKKHLQYVRSLPCFICKAGFITHSDVVQAHHLLNPNKGYKNTNKRMGVRSDDSDVIPLCLMHHHILHTKFGNEAKFFESYGMKSDAGQKYAKALYNKTMYIDDSDDDLPF